MGSWLASIPLKAFCGRRDILKTWTCRYGQVVSKIDESRSRFYVSFGQIFPFSEETYISRHTLFYTHVFQTGPRQVRSWLATSLLLLEIAQGWIAEQSDGAGQVDADVAAVGPELCGDGPDVPDLGHAGDAAGEVAGQQADDGGGAERQGGRLVPDLEVVARAAAAEDLVLEQQDEGEGDGPVAQQRDEVGHDGRETVFARDGEDGDHERDRERPDEARDGVEVVA